ncbi:SNF2 helicase associated domain-containing protein [Paenibacillus sp. GCM10012306]|uniref:DEAD/DEAH box helicase n=1 Tax=Paenibacillus sp. GCM10012306 TaxID=3317342 RepID=UPI003618A85E
MGYSVPERVIKLLCGKAVLEEGAILFHSNKVQLTWEEQQEERGGIVSRTEYEAIVQGHPSYDVKAAVDSDGDVRAECSCPAYSHGGPYCKHIAAVLIHIHELAHADHSDQRSENSILHQHALSYREDGRLTPRNLRHSSGSPAQDSQLVDSMLGMFGNSRPRPRPSGAGTYVDTRDTLVVEWTVRPMTSGYGSTEMLGIELKIGPKRLYIVQKIRTFLEAIHRGENFEFSRHFVYSPSQYSFLQKDNEIIQKLLQIIQSEKVYRDSLGINSQYGNRASGERERLLPIPPYFWKELQPLLATAPSVHLQQGDHLYEGVNISQGTLPLVFQLDQAKSGGYRLEVQGLDNITVLENYDLVLSAGQLLELPSQECGRLAGIKRMLGTSSQSSLGITPTQIESFMDKVIPGLVKLGTVTVAESISDRILHSPLKARLYLDRIRDRLLAGLEFQYGDIVLNPLEEHRSRGTDLILMRDGEREARIMELMENAAFVRTESSFLMSNEDDEFDFLYHTVPLLEDLLEVYATTAVKERLLTGNPPPKVNVSWNEKTDWLDFKFDMGGIPEEEIAALLKALQEKRRYYRLPDGALLPLDTEELQEMITFMNEVGIKTGEIQGKAFSLPLIRGLHLGSTDHKGDAVKLDKSFRKLLANLQNPDNLDFPVPDSLFPVLRDYQQLGFQWLKTLAHYRFGGILADDMGLGKTLQSITFLLSELPDIRDGGRPALIVAPASLLYNWHNELKKFAPEIKAVIADGNLTERSRTLKNTAEADVIITSYPLLRRDVKLYNGISFHTLILDEAQVIKNEVTQTARAVRSLQARYRFALTGTPVENALEDLWSIFSAVFPGLFPENKKTFHDLPRAAVAKRARPFLLRRLKRDVLKELPDKIESVQASELLPDQKKLYVAYLARLQKEALKHLDSDGFGGFGEHRIKILAGLTRLRQLCCHPSLFIEGYQGGSGKFEQLLEIIAECRSSGKRMLVFSQFTSMLDLIGRELGVQGVPYFYLDGQTPPAQRTQLCQRFNEGEGDLFLISLKAGGTGLNLTGADTVILYDLWWNPAVEQQAADRAHRIGQKNVVQVIRLVAQGTVEDKMYELQQKKKNLIDEVIQPGHESLSALTEQDIREILRI